MTKGTNQTLKSQNFAWHIALVTADAIALALFVAPELVTRVTATQLGIYRALAAVVLPVVVLLLVNLMSSSLKAMFVYWKPYGWLPGCEAFSRYGPLDHRVDMTQLRKNTGAWPEAPREQNAKWFKLFKMVEGQADVVGAHKDFLLYRDMAAFSLPLILLAPLGVYIAGASPSAIWVSAGLCAVQYILAAISAANSGKRFVCNVLAQHSVKKITMPKTPSA
jgi:hypothetical protein